jgi:hypothetical protein
LLFPNLELVLSTLAVRQQELESSLQEPSDGSCDFMHFIRKPWIAASGSDALQLQQDEVVVLAGCIPPIEASR